METGSVLKRMWIVVALAAGVLALAQDHASAGCMVGPGTAQSIGSCCPGGPSTQTLTFVGIKIAADCNCEADNTWSTSWTTPQAPARHKVYYIGVYMVYFCGEECIVGKKCVPAGVVVENTIDAECN